MIIGFLGIYQLGAAAAIRRWYGQEELKTRVTSYIGTSFGAAAACLLACDMDAHEYAPLFVEAARDTRSKPLKSLTPGFYPVQYLHTAMHAELPANAHQLCEGRLWISLSVQRPGKRSFSHQLISSYPSRSFLIDALCAACWIPALTGATSLPRLGDDIVMDGTLTASLTASHPSNQLPTLIISPFSNGRFSICPQHAGSTFKFTIPTGRQFSVSSWNLRALGRAVVPPAEKELLEFYALGWRDASIYCQERWHPLLKCPTVDSAAPPLLSRSHTACRRSRPGSVSAPRTMDSELPERSASGRAK